MKPTFPIVGIGASAGGLEAFSELLTNLDIHTGMAFVLIQHLSPDHASLLREILARTTAMTVHEVIDGVTVEPNQVYVMPPNTQIALLNGQLWLTPRIKKIQGEMHCPINDFFASLALEQKELAVGVILSGSGSDGAKGLAAISAAGGVTFVQDTDSAKFDPMPIAGAAVGVDFVLNPAGIAAKLKIIAKK